MSSWPIIPDQTNLSYILHYFFDSVTSLRIITGSPGWCALAEAIMSEDSLIA